MSNLIPFESAKLPTFLKGGRAKSRDLSNGVGGGFPVLSIKGKTWTVVRGKDDRKILRNPKDPDEPASNVSLVILKSSPTLSRVFYIKEFEDGGAMGPPDCFSNDAVRPDAAVEKPQAKSCAACPNAVFVGGKAPKCSNNRRLAVAPAGALEDPMLLRVPGASLKPLAAYGGMLAGRDIPYDAVVTKIRFDPEEATPKLMFEPVAFVDDEMYAKIQKIAASDVVDQILGLAGGTEDTPIAEPVVKVTADEVAEVLEEPKAEPKKAKKTKVVEPEPEEDDEEDATPEPVASKVADLAEKREAKKTEAKPAAKPDSLVDALDGFLAAYDD